MRRAALLLLGSWILAAATGCGGETCKDLPPAVRVTVRSAAAQPVRSIVVTLSAEGKRWENTFDIGDQLADGATSIGVQIEPPPAAAFEVEVSARAFAMENGAGAVLAEGSVRRQATADACNEIEIALGAPSAPDGGAPDTGRRDAGVPDAIEPTADATEPGPDAAEDAGLPDAIDTADAEPSDAIDTADAADSDAEPTDAIEGADVEPTDATETADAEPTDAQATDAEPADVEPTDATDTADAQPDSGVAPDDAEPSDALDTADAQPDSGVAPGDAGPADARDDAAVSPDDSGVRPDALPAPDAGGPQDAQPTDTGVRTDAGPVDTGAVGPTDSGPADTGARDSGFPDAQTPDSGADAGVRPLAIVFVTPPQTLAANACSAIATVELQAAGLPVPALAPTTIALEAAPPAGFTFYADSACTTPASSRIISTGSSRVSFHFRGTVAQNVVVTASSQGLSSGTQTETIQAGPLARLGFTTAPQTVTAGNCSAIMVVQSQDAFGNGVNVGVATPVSVAAGAPGLTFFQNGTCTVPLGQLTIQAGARTAVFFFRGTTAGAPVITASSPPLTAATQQETITAAAATRLNFTTVAQTLAAGACSGATTVQALDAFNNPAPRATARTVTLSAAPPTGFTFYSDAGCTSPVTQVDIPANASTVTFRFRATRAGSPVITAATAGLTSANQTETINPGPTMVFVFDQVDSPKVVGASFSVTIRSRDAYTNPTAYAGTAVLSLSPAGTAACRTSCTNGTTTSAFVNGFWRGRVSAGPSAAAGVQLVATSGPARGTSNAFDLLDPPVEGTRPIAFFTATPAAGLTGSTFAYNASASSDAETATPALEVSWDYSGTNPAAPPWTAWTTVKTTTTTYLVAGRYSPRLAVRDADGNVTVATQAVVAVATAAELCVVDTTSDDDDGASSCAGPFGGDGRLSLTEAVRLSNAVAGRQAITFSGVTRLVAPNANIANLTLTAPADVVASGNVILDGYFFRADSGASFISGLEITAARNELRVRSPGTLAVQDVYIHDSRGFSAEGALTLTRVRGVDCASGTAACVVLGAAGASATIRHSLFMDVPAPAVLLQTCGAGTVLDMQSTVIARTTIGVSAACNGTTLIRNVTFDANQTAVSYAGGTGHVLANGVFTNHSAAAVLCGTAAFARRDRHLFFQNSSNGCVANDPSSVSADPWFLFEAAGDYRLHFHSPAKDTGVDLGLDLNDVAPGLYFGLAPDRGGRETW